MAGQMLDVQVQMRAKGQPYAVATVVETAGSVSAKTGAKAIIDGEGRVVAGWVGGGCAEATTCNTALQCLASGETAVIDIDLDDEVWVRACPAAAGCGLRGAGAAGRRSGS
jgi:xanthine dehydrogenase accessory factor